MTPQDTSPLRYLWLFGLTRGRIISFAGLSVLAAALEGFGMAMFLPVLQYMEKGQDAAFLAGTSTAWRYLVDALAAVGAPTTLLTLLVAAISVMMVRVGAVYVRQVYVAWLTQETQHVTRSTLFNAYLGLNYGAYAGQSSGSMVNMLTIEVPRAAGSFAALFALLANAAVASGFLIVLLWLSTPLTLLAVGFLGTAGVAVAYYVRHTRRESHAATDANDTYARVMLERLNSFRLILLTAATARETARVAAASATVRDRLYWLQKIVASVDLILEPTVLIAGGLILYMAVSFFGMTLSEIGIFVMVLLRLLPLVKEMMRSRQTYNSCVGSLSAVIGSYRYACQEKEAASGTRAFTRIQSAVRFEGVTFSFPGADQPTVIDLSVSIPAGKVTALVGPSGAGKTTVIDLLARLRVPQQGKILFDDIDSADLDLGSLRRGMAVVSQDTAILDDTVAGNLRFVKPEADEAALWQALEKAQAAGFVRAMDQGLQTRLGERGTRLSGGQRQRLSLARAFLQDTGLLVLDEPTSALDSETETLVQEALETLRRQGNVTVIVIAHRLSTIRDADQIVVMQDGRVAEAGTHGGLIQSSGWYARVWAMQGSETDTDSREEPTAVKPQGA